MCTAPDAKRSRHTSPLSRPRPLRDDAVLTKFIRTRRRLLLKPSSSLCVFVVNLRTVVHHKDTKTRRRTEQGSRNQNYERAVTNGAEYVFLSHYGQSSRLDAA